MAANTLGHSETRQPIRFFRLIKLPPAKAARLRAITGQWLKQFDLSEIGGVIVGARLGPTILVGKDGQAITTINIRILTSDTTSKPPNLPEP
jgi:hypothetical protein